MVSSDCTFYSLISLARLTERYGSVIPLSSTSSRTFKTRRSRDDKRNHHERERERERCSMFSNHFDDGLARAAMKKNESVYLSKFETLSISDTILVLVNPDMPTSLALYRHIPHFLCTTLSLSLVSRRRQFIVRWAR